jgi:hypothetical protein
LGVTVGVAVREEVAVKVLVAVDSELVEGEEVAVALEV